MVTMISTSGSRFRLPKYLRTYFVVSLIASCLLTLFVTISYFRLQPVVPIFYSLGEPTDYVADKTWLFFFPAFSFTVTILHLLILPTLRSYHKVMNQLFGWVTLMMQALCIVAAVRIILIIW